MMPADVQRALAVLVDHFARAQEAVRLDPQVRTNTIQVSFAHPETKTIYFVALAAVGPMAEPGTPSVWGPDAMALTCQLAIEQMVGMTR